MCDVVVSSKGCTVRSECAALGHSYRYFLLTIGDAMQSLTPNEQAKAQEAS